MQYVQQLNAALEGTLAPNTETIKQVRTRLSPAIAALLHTRADAETPPCSTIARPPLCRSQILLSTRTVYVRHDYRTQATKVLNEQFYKSPKCVPALFQILQTSQNTTVSDGRC